MHSLAILVVWKFLDFGRPEVDFTHFAFSKKFSKSDNFSPGIARTLKLRI